MVENIKVLIIDDSRSIHKMLELFFSKHTDIECIGAAMDPYEAAQIMKKNKPDVILLDVKMPGMDGLTFLKKLMEQHPIPVVIHSSLITKNPNIGIKALEYGAVEVIDKPVFDMNDLKESKVHEKRIVDLVRQVGKTGTKRNKIRTKSIIGIKSPDKTFEGKTNFKHLICVGASAGGIQTIKYLLSKIPEDFPPILIVQHMPVEFTGQFAQHLDNTSHMHVVEARDREIIKSGHVYIAPGNRHLTIKKSGQMYQVRLEDGPTVSNHKPSVDVLFKSAATISGVELIGVLLTGMGKDGAEGLLEMRNAGFTTIAQDETTSTVYGMPRKAAELGAAEKICALENIPLQLKQLIKYKN